MQNEMVMRCRAARWEVPIGQALARRMVIEMKCFWGGRDRKPEHIHALERRRMRRHFEMERGD